jgi:hypothetical protein
MAQYAYKRCVLLYAMLWWQVFKSASGKRQCMVQPRRGKAWRRVAFYGGYEC